MNDSSYRRHKLFPTCKTVSIVLMSQDIFASCSIGPLCSFSVLLKLDPSFICSVEPAIHHIAVEFWTEPDELGNYFTTGFIFKHPSHFVIYTPIQEVFLRVACSVKMKFHVGHDFLVKIVGLDFIH